MEFADIIVIAIIALIIGGAVAYIIKKKKEWQGLHRLSKQLHLPLGKVQL